MHVVSAIVSRLDALSYSQHSFVILKFHFFNVTVNDADSFAFSSSGFAMFLSLIHLMLLINEYRVMNHALNLRHLHVLMSLYSTLTGFARFLNLN